MMDILVIHIGAGIHDHKLTHKYKSLLRKALSKKSILESSKIVESSSLTNTGYGSSLNVLGNVECDASFIMNDSTTTTTTTNQQRLGSLVNMTCKFPILELFRVFGQLDELYENELDLTSPLMLTYPSLQNTIIGITKDSSELISPKARRVYELYKDEVFQDKRLPHGISDTIGILHVHENVTTIATSSGGNLFKLPGRIGCAGVLGAGIAFSDQGAGVKIGCMCSGNGEQIIQYNLAQVLVDNIGSFSDDNYGECIEKLLRGFSGHLYVGFIVVIQKQSSVQLLYGHTTESFHFGFRVGECKTKVILSYSEHEGKLTFGEYILI